ncbi:MAG TPA: UvrB/UvrC motif-containing protein [Clostridia bacterium]|nr:UvrB/UvrC motif-containing protein [Clostridia bacterium]
MTKIINNKKTQTHLCESCASEKEDLNWLTPFSINELLTSFLQPIQVTMAKEEIAPLKCHVCGMNYRQFKKTGRLGCENCYKAFKDELNPIIKRIQGGSHHAGKIPKDQEIMIRTNKEIEDLQYKLKEAVDKEAFEEAATLRDRIRGLENNEKSKEGDRYELD